MAASRNPYVAGSPVGDGPAFVGRADVLCARWCTECWKNKGWIAQRLRSVDNGGRHDSRASAQGMGRC
jgi:hypothetical protein